YIWTLPEGATGTSSTNNISVKFSKDAIPGKITVKGTNQCGEGIEATKDINILYLPAKAAAPTGNNFICANNDYNIYSTTGAAYAQNYKWVLYPANAGNIFENNKTATIYWNKTYAGYCYLKLKAENTCGSGLYSDSLSIYLQPLPSTPGLPAGLTRVCNNSGQTLYNVNKIKYSDTYTWELIPSNAGKLNVSDTLVKISWDSSFTGSVLLRTKAGNICGESSFGPPLNIELISKPAQAGTISGLDSLCEGTNGATYSIVPVNNTESYQWNLPQGATGISASNKIIVDFALQASAGKISVKAYNQCGFGKAAFKDITIKYKPGQAAKPKGEQHICLNQSNNTIYSSDGALYASSYLWELTPGNAGSVYSNNKNVNIIWNTNYSGIVNLKLKGVNNCGSGQFSDSLLINLDHQPDPPLTPAGATPICNNSGTSLYLIPEVNNTTNYKWELFPAEAATMLQNGTNVNLKLDSLFAGYALLNVKAVNTCGESSSSPSFKINITSKPYPAGFISGLDSVCEAAIGMNYEIVALSNADDYVWTLAEDFSGSSLSNKINVNFSKNAHNGKITVSGKNSCGLGKASIKNITIKHYPLKPATPTGSELICLNTVSNSLYTSSGALYATSYIWNLEPANAGTIWSDNKSASIIWNKNYKGYARLKLKGVNNCGGGVWSDSLNIFIEQLPAVPAIATGDLLPCNNISFSEYKIPLIENALQYNWELNPASAAILTPYCSLYPDSCVRYPELAGAIIVKWDSLFYGAVQLKVNSENQCGLSDLSPALNINVNTKPSEAAYIFGLDSLCEGTTVADYYINPVARAEHYNWLLAEGITGESDSSHILLNFNKGETLSKIKVYASNNCGQGKAAYKSIYTKPLPLMRGCSQLPGIAICCLDSSGSACPSVLCFNPPDMEFKIDSANYALNYEWSIEPPEAGYINYNRLHAKVNWNDTYSGGVTIRVKAINNCGYSLQDAMHKLYINAAPQFSLPLLSEGPIITCQKTKSVYHFKALNDTLNYQWTLNPPSAGILTSYKDSLYIEWDSAYLDTSRLIYKVSNQCSMGLYTDSLTISVNSIPEPARTVSGDTLLCQGLSEVVFSTPAIKYATNYNWLFPKGFSFSGNPDSSVVKVNISDSAITGAIYIRGSNICGLGEAASMQLTVKALPVKPFIYSHNLKLCYYSEKSSVYIKKEPGVISYNYILNPPNAGVFSDVDNNPIITWDPDFTGEAFLQIQTANDCGYGKYCDPLKFSINIPEQVKLPSDTTINLPQSITISTDKDYKTYNWSNTSIDKQITIHSETLGIGSHIYSVTVTDFNDCFSHDSITIKVDSALKNIINPSLAKQINAYYNLTDKRIYIKSSINLENTKLALYNNEGQKLYSLYINSIPANSTYSFSLNNNSATAPNPRKDTNPALYFLNIINNSFNITKKLIIY
ncbi:MAG: hypothetical protein KA792_06715, partial [Bacteroidales bacterium]|nr:hypothetical protein [Bacteroidales bacterium]